MDQPQDDLRSDNKDADLYIELPLDHETIERFKACKEAQFPLCLDKAVAKIFGNKEIMFSVAEKAGFKATNVSSMQDIWDLYMKLGAVWGKQMGANVTAVIEFASLKEMKSMGCTKCPLYEMELERKSKNLSP
ncbi:MAG: hypothetical protein JRN15_09945 [Nitrososphaerota archaeon]|nr:hypothetical protein [Nitrososphaerota archaeon]